MQCDPNQFRSPFLVRRQRNQLWGVGRRARRAQDRSVVVVAPPPPSRVLNHKRAPSLAAIRDVTATVRHAGGLLAGCISTPRLEGRTLSDDELTVIREATRPRDMSASQLGQAPPEPATVARLPPCCTDSNASVALQAAPGPTQRRMPLYYFAAGDEVGLRMEELFVSSVRGAGDADAFDLRNFRHSSSDTRVYEHGSRWAMKLDFIINALQKCAAENEVLNANAHAQGGAVDPGADVIVVSDVDLTFRRPFAPIVRRYLQGRDMVFQSDCGDKVGITRLPVDN